MAVIADRVNPAILEKARRYLDLLQARGMRIQRAYLFGSHARGQAHPGSDIDLAIVSPDLSGDWLDDFCLLTRLADEVDPWIEVIPFLPEDFREENPLVFQVKSTGILLSDPDLGESRQSP